MKFCDINYYIEMYFCKSRFYNSIAAHIKAGKAKPCFIKINSGSQV